MPGSVASGTHYISFYMHIGSNFFYEFSALLTGEVFLLRQVFVYERNPISLCRMQNRFADLRTFYDH